MTGAAPLYGRVALIGLGLIAGSMAHAMRAGGLAAEIVGNAKSAETRDVPARCSATGSATPRPRQ